MVMIIETHQNSFLSYLVYLLNISVFICFYIPFCYSQMLWSTQYVPLPLAPLLLLQVLLPPSSYTALVVVPQQLQRSEAARDKC
jgi:hypothetical protein